MEPLSIALTERNILYRSGMKMILQSSAQFNIILETDTGESLLQELNEAPRLPNICILDYGAKSMDGIKILKTIRSRFVNIQIVLYSQYYQRTLINEALRYGAAAFFSRDASVDEILRLLTQVSNGHTEHASHNKWDDECYFPTQKEIDIINLCAKDISSQQMAGILGVSKRTIDAHFNRLFERLEISSRAGLVSYGFKHGLIPL